MHVKYNKENNTLSNRLSTFKKWGYRLPNPSKMVWVEPGKWTCFSHLGLQDAQVPQHDRKMVPRCSPRPSKLSKKPPQNHCRHHERCWSSGSCIQYLNHHHNHCHHRNRWDHPCHKWPIGCLLPTIRHSSSCIRCFQTSSDGFCYNTSVLHSFMTEKHEKSIKTWPPDHQIGQVKLQPQLWDHQKAFETSPKALG